VKGKPGEFNEADVTAEVRRLVSRFAPSGTPEERLGADVPLGARGLGLDSVAIVELLVACEKRFGIRFPGELLEGGPLTIGRLARHLEECCGPGGAVSRALP
jgi:acyl carrier protein